MAETSGEVLESGNLRLDVDACTVMRKGHTTRLGAIECQMLTVLMRAEGRPVSMEALGRALWGIDSAGAAGRVRGVAKRLRAKLRGVRIETIVREGYVLAVDC